MKKFLTIFASALFSLAIAQGAFAISYTTTTIHHPGLTSTGGIGLNDNGYVVGHYGNYDDTVWVNKGYVFDGQNFIDISIPGAASTDLNGINNKGDLIGNYSYPLEIGSHAFLYSKGALTSLDYSGAKYNGVLDINNSGQILGAYSNDLPYYQYFLYESGNFTILDAQFPGAASTHFYGLNDNGDLVGAYFTADYNHKGFIYSGGEFVEVDHPVDSSFEFLADINNSGQAIGMYQDDIANPIGFLYENGEFSYLPVLSDDQGFTQINNNGQITGYYLGTWDDNEVNLAYLLTPKKPVATPEPSTVFLLGAVIAGIFVSSRFKRHAL